METQKSEAEELLSGQAEIWRLMFAFADSMAVKAAVELRIPDIIHAHASPITLSQIASSIDSLSPDTSYLARIMRLLVRRNLFTAHHCDDTSDGAGETTLYGPTAASRWLLREGPTITLAPMFLMENHPWLLAPWHSFSKCVREGGVAFEKAHGCGIWDFAAKNPEFNRIFNDGMACTASVVTRGFLIGYGRDGFGSIGSLVDVGGGTGTLISEIVKSYPHIRGINFDLPHVVTTAPEYKGVEHRGGDMFHEIPNADAVIMKWIMHDWSDEDCVKILKNCRKAISKERNGKVIILDVVLRPEGSDPFDDTGVVFDLVMMAHVTGGKERTEVEWKKLLDQSGFPRYNIIAIPALLSIIEAYPS